MQKIRISQGRHGTHQSVLSSNLSKYVWRVQFKTLALTTVNLRMLLWTPLRTASDQTNKQTEDIQSHEDDLIIFA